MQTAVRNIEAMTTNPYLSGVHTPLQEEFTLENLEVTGAIPTALDGRYLRLGPNPMDPNPARYHWFSGDGMVHGIRIQNGRALWYRNRWVRSKAVAKALGERDVEGPRHAFDTVNTNVVHHAGKTLGVVEAGSTPVEFGDFLETLRYTDFNGSLHGSFSAHPHVDPESGEMHAICYDVSQRGAVRYVVITPQGEVRREVTIPTRHGPMIHDSAISQRYAVILDLPVTFSLKAAAGGFAFPYRWRKAHSARLGLLPREGEAKDVIWCPLDACFVFHTINSFDLPDGKVVVDVIVHDRMFAESYAGPDSRQTALERWVVDPVAKRVERTVIDPTPQEFPRPDERRLTRPYRYAYTMELTAPFLGLRIFKQDLEKRTRQEHDFGPGKHPCEFVFIPAHAKAEEDEGWLMGFVVDANATVTDLVILDARNVEGAPLASIRIPHIVPPGFHGNWIAS